MILYTGLKIQILKSITSIKSQVLGLIKDHLTDFREMGMSLLECGITLLRINVYP